jgi:hypothetical protein
MLAALAASQARLTLAGWDPQDDLQGSKQTFLVAGLAGLQGPLQCLQSPAHRALGSQSPITRFSLSFLLSGTPAGRTVSRLSGGVIGGRCIGLNEKAK